MKLQDYKRLSQGLRDDAADNSINHRGILVQLISLVTGAIEETDDRLKRIENHLKIKELK